MNSRLEGEGGDDLGLGLGQIDEAPFDLAGLVVSAGELAEELRVPTLRLCQPRVEPPERWVLGMSRPLLNLVG